jgi:hypothetical protein
VCAPVVNVRLGTEAPLNDATSVGWYGILPAARSRSRPPRWPARGSTASRARACRLHGELVVLHAADHVVIEIGRDVARSVPAASRTNAADPINRFPRGPERNQDVTRNAAASKARRPSPGPRPSRTRCRRRRRVPCRRLLPRPGVPVLAVAKVIEVGADRDPWLRLPVVLMPWPGR